MNEEKNSKDTAIAEMIEVIVARVFLTIFEGCNG